MRRKATAAFLIAAAVLTNAAVTAHAGSITRRGDVSPMIQRHLFLPAGAAQRQTRRDHDKCRQHPPRGHALVGQRCGRGESEDDAQCQSPVVPDDEVVAEHRECPQPAHDGAPVTVPTGRLRSTKTEPIALTAVTSTITGSAASLPGQETPAPSAPQNIPNEVKSTPTANFKVFSGIRASGARAAIPTAVTTSTAAAAPNAASGMLPWVAPKVKTMNATSRPSKKTPLNDSVNA